MGHPAWWVYPLLMCLVLTGIHGYLGIHVLKRKVIFVDLAMAQIAALGAAYAVLLGYDPAHPENTLPVYFFSLGFTLAGAAVISLTRMRHERVPQEAFIGIVYASASALAILLLARSPVEGQIKHMLAGSLLTVEPVKIPLTAAIYSAIGLFHWIYRKKFFLISEDPEAARESGLRVRFWDFLFYVSFGIVITSSVSIAGVLLVFSYLVVPGVIGVIYADGTRARIMIAWGVGTVVSVLGMVLSYRGDFPTGPSIVAAFAAVLVAAGLLRYVTTAKHPGAALGRVMAGAAVVGSVLWGTMFLAKSEPEHAHSEGDLYSRCLEGLRSANPDVVIESIHELEVLRDPHAVQELSAVVERTSSDRVIEHAVKALASLDASEAVPVLQRVASKDLDSDLKVVLARAILDLHDPAGFPILIDVFEKADANQARREAKELIEERTGRVFGDLESLKLWWADRGASLRWKSQVRRFE